MSRFGLLARVLLVAALASVVAAPQASAGNEPPVAATLTLAGQDAWTVLGGDVGVRLHVEGTVPGLTLSVVARQAVTSRATFERTARDESLGSVLDQVSVPLDALGADSAGERVVALGLEAPGSARDVNRLGIRRAGVYPLEMELHDDEDRTLSRFVTYVVAVDPTAPALEAPLGVAWVWPLVAGPAVLPDGNLDPAVVASFGPSGRLGRQAAALRRNADVPVTVVPGPETLQAWATAGRDEPGVADGVAAVRSSLAAHQIVSGPYVPVDLPSLLAAGMVGAADTQLVQGHEALTRFFGTSIDRSTALVRPVDTAALARLRVSGVEHAVLDASAVTPTDARVTSARPFTVEATGFVGSGPVSAVAGDEGLEALLAGEASPALKAQRVLAGLSLVALEQPSVERAVVLVNPDTFDPSATLMDAVFAGLRGNPWLHAMKANDVFEQVPPETEDNDTAVSRTLVPYNPPRPPVNSTRYDTAVGRLNAFRTLVAPGDERVAVAERAVVSSVSSAWSSPEAAPRAEAELGVVDATIDAFIAQIRVPDPSTITLTSRSGEIPLTFQNDTGQTVSVLIQLESQKLAFPDGASRLVDLPPKSTTISFAVEARTSGSFPLRLTVLSADGSLPITNTDFRVQSTAVSTVGLIVMVSAGIFLALWWGLDFRRRQRARIAAREIPVPTA